MLNLQVIEYVCQIFNCYVSNYMIISLCEAYAKIFINSENVSLTLNQSNLTFKALKVNNTGLKSWDITQFQCKNIA